MNNEYPLLTLSTCWYLLKSKFDENTYSNWISNFLSMATRFNLVIYTDENSFQRISHLANNTNKNVKIIFKPIDQFYTYKYKDLWIKNHEKSGLMLHKWVCWELNMLWNEKVFFVEETIKNQYFTTPYYGWCDIGYFRNRYNDLNSKDLIDWANTNVINNIPCIDTHIHYGCVQNNTFIIANLAKEIKSHYELCKKGYPTTQFETICFAGGFFILRKELIDKYVSLYDEKLLYYFSNSYLIKDDQTIIADIIFTNESMFYIHTEHNNRYDNWFMFQRILKQ
jgi:hypothetical protein